MKTLKIALCLIFLSCLAKAQTQQNGGGWVEKAPAGTPNEKMLLNSIEAIRDSHAFIESMKGSFDRRTLHTASLLIFKQYAALLKLSKEAHVAALPSDAPTTDEEQAADPDRTDGKAPGADLYILMDK